MLLAEDLLLVTDDASGRLSAPAAQVDAGLGGANLDANSEYERDDEDAATTAAGTSAR